MSGFSMRLSVIAVIAAVTIVAMVGCKCDDVKEQLAACEEKLEKSDPMEMAPTATNGGGDGTEFTLTLENDGYGTFQPFNNQYRGEERVAHHRHGFLVQVGDFLGAAHPYATIELKYAKDGSIKRYARGDGPPAWIDIVCGDTSKLPLTDEKETKNMLEKAKMLVPEKSVGSNDKRRLHTDLKVDSPVTAVTLWGPKEGLTLTTAYSDETDKNGNHGHAVFTIKSGKACDVRVWGRVYKPDGSVEWASDPEVFSIANDKQVSELVVPNPQFKDMHGGPHMPTW